MMYFKVITITLISMCAADDQLLFLEPLSEAEVAPPAPSFKRQIFPMMYEYTRHGISTPVPKARSPRSATPTEMLWKLQYAPLYDGTRDYMNPTPTQSRTPEEPTERFQDKKNRHFSKTHLEPRTEGTDKKCYASEHKKKAKSSASRSPGHNAVYRKIAEKIITEEPVTSQKPIGINFDFESVITSTQLPVFEFTPDNRRDRTLAKEHFIINPISLETALPVRDKSKRYSSHPKYHRLHLNIARVYSPGQVPPKPPAYGHAYPEHFGEPPKTQVYRSQAHHHQSHQDKSKNTLLFPVKHHRKGNYRVHPSILHY